jgi:hypothetical protein
MMAIAITVIIILISVSFQLPYACKSSTKVATTPKKRMITNCENAKKVFLDPWRLMTF